MSRKKWCTLSQADHDAWDQLSTAGEITILGTSASTAQPPGHLSETACPPPSCRSINLHDISMYDYLLMHPESHTGSKGDVNGNITSHVNMMTLGAPPSTQSHIDNMEEMQNMFLAHAMT